jgi:hypothetical protein
LFIFCCVSFHFIVNCPNNKWELYSISFYHHSISRHNICGTIAILQNVWCPVVSFLWTFLYLISVFCYVNVSKKICCSCLVRACVKSMSLTILTSDHKCQILSTHILCFCFLTGIANTIQELPSGNADLCKCFHDKS